MCLFNFYERGSYEKVCFVSSVYADRYFLAEFMLCFNSRCKYEGYGWQADKPGDP